ncbi:MAG: DHHW family protein [Lachnospiraceae bacterium]|nr:DHHW family protein [Lachnospiraceae bacterium]
MKERKRKVKRGRSDKLTRLRRKHNKMLAIVFLGVLLLCTVLNIVVKDRSFSEEENRSLAQMPAFSKDALADGSYFKGLESYVADQFFARDSWISLKMAEDQFLGRKESGDVFLGKDGYLLGQPDEPAPGLIDNDIRLINAFAEKYNTVSMNMMVVPGSALVTPQYLPKNALVYNQLADIQAVYNGVAGHVNCVDAATVLSPHSEEYIYYKTDHHWTSLGAKYAFDAIQPSLGIDDQPEFQVYTVATGFQGTLSSRSGSRKSSDTVDIYVHANKDTAYYVDYISTGERSASIYQSAALENKDKYTVFFGGNYPILEINTDCINGRTLMIFKDSYANSFVQFLVPYFQRIVLVDPRYYYDNIDAAMINKGVTDVLFLYSADTFLTDGGLADVLESAFVEAE